MSDSKKYYDSDGKEIQLPASSASKSYYDVNGSPIQLNPATAGKFGSELAVPQTKSDVENVVAPYLGRLAVQAPPIIGSEFGPGGTMIGTGVSQLLKAGFPKVFGQPAENLPLQGAEDLTLNNLIPGGIGKIAELISGGTKALPATAAFRNFPATREGAAREMTSQIMGKFGAPQSETLERGALDASQTQQNLFSDVTMQRGLHPIQSGQAEHPAVQQAIADLENTFGKNKVGRQLLKLHKDMAAGFDVAGTQTYKQIADTALSDITHVRNWKLAAGPQGIEELAINKLLQTGAGKEGILDSGKVLAELGGKNSQVYEEAIGPQTFNDFKDLINEVHSQQAGHGISDAVVRYSKGRLLWATGLAGGIHGALGLPGVAAGGVTVTNSMLARAMQNPETARIVVEALRTSGGSQKGQMLNSVLSNLWKTGAGVAATPDQ